MDHKKKGKKELHVTYLTTLQWQSAQAPQRQYSLHPVMLRTIEVAQVTFNSLCWLGTNKK
jgi:hypothetical protein